MEMEHSRLLKFFKKSGHNKPKMAETPEIPVIKIQKEYQNPPNVEAEVPGTHEIREFDNKNDSSEMPGAEQDKNKNTEIPGPDDKNTSSEIKITGADFTLSPVITVTKTESMLTKGDMKLQKVTVTEDIAEEESENGVYRISRDLESLTQAERQTVSVTVEASEEITDTMEGEEKSQDEKKSKIPMLRLRQAVERVKREREAQKARGVLPRRSSIPKLKDAKKVIKRDTSLNFTPQIDDDFDKLYEEIVDNNHKNIEEKLPSVTMEDPEKIETKFEEIIHAYDEDEHEKQTVSKVSKIPALKRKDEDGPSRLGALIHRAKEKSTITESKLKDGGFKVTASTIRTKRFSRGNSRDLGSEQQIEVTKTIDIRESGDNDVFVKETVIKKTAPAKPERTFRNITKRVVADNKAGTVENIEDDGKQTTVTEDLDKKDGTLNKTKRFTRTVSKETRERNLNRELSRNLENVRREFKNRIEDSRLDDEFKDVDNHVITTQTITENAQATPIKTERIARGVSKEYNEDGQNINSIETVTVEELEDGGTRTITTKTIESLVIGTPVVTEKVIRNISREISTEGENNSIKGVTTIEESTDGGSKKVTKETYVRENKGIPVKTERYTRGISREIGNIKQRSSSKEIDTAVDDSSPQVLKKDTKKTEQIEKEVGKVGIPVFTKVTRSFSKGKIQNVEMSRTIEWKPADEVKSKNFSRSTSEKVTKKELKDAGKWKYEAPTAISEVTNVNDKPTEKNNITSIQNNAPKDPVLENRIKDTVKDIASKIRTKKVTEYKSNEQVTNVEKTTYTLSSNIDLTVDRDLKASREIGTQMSIDGKPVDRNFKFVKEFGTQMSVEGKPLESPFDRDFKLAKDRNLETKIEYMIKIATTPIDGDGNASKEFGTKMTTVENPVFSSIDGNSKASREFGTQMSVVGKIVDRDFKVSKEIGTQMSLEGSKQIQENDFDKLSKENATVINTDNITPEKSEKEYSKLSTQTKNSDIAETTVLKGNVSRMKDKIAKETVVISKKEPDVELPKKKSVLSKIAIFESLEPNEPYPAVEVPTRKIKCKYVPPNLNRTNSADRPKIVNELLKEETQSEPLGDISKVEIGETYDEVTYRSEPVVVKEYSRTEEVYGQDVSDIKQMNIEIKVTSAHSQLETKDFETAKILPGTIEFKTQDSQIEYSKTMDGKTQNQRESSVIEMPTIFPAKMNYEADIGKTKPGKINLNIWSTQVEINKSTVDKIDFLREESLHDVAQILPGKVDFKTYESQVPVSTALPGIIDFKQEANQIESVTILPAKINFKSEEVAQTLVGRIDSKTNDSQNAGTDNLSGITHDYLVDDVTTLPAKIDTKSYEIQTEIATTLPGQIEANSNQTEIAKTLTAFGYASVEKQPKNYSTISKKEVSAKPKPGKINLNLWQNQVETNKTLVGKTGIIKKSKEAEISKALSGRVNFNSKPVRVTETVQGNYVINKREYKAEIAKTSTVQIDSSPNRGPIGGPNTLPGKIEFDLTESHSEIAKPLLGFVDFSSNETQEATIRTLPETANFSFASSQAEVATILPGIIEFSSSENQVEEPKILIRKIDFETDFVTNESKSEISETLQDNIYFGSTDNKTESITTLSQQSSVEKVGKLDLKAWEHQVEVNKTLVDKIDVVKGEHLEEIAKTLPGKIELTNYESHVGEAKTFQAPIDRNTEENQVEEPKMLIGKIDFETEFMTNESKAEISETLQDNIYFGSTDNQTESITTLSQQSSVEKVGKLDLKAWEHQVEVNKTLVDKIDVVKGEHLEEIAKTLPGKIELTNYESHVGEAKTFQAPIDRNTEENQIEEPKMLIGKTDFETEFMTNESKAEISETLQDNIYFGSTDNQTESITTLSKQSSVEKVGKLDLKAWEHQVEVNKTLVDKIDVVKGEHLEEIAKTLPGKIELTNYESHVGEAKTFQAPVDLNTEENKVEITEIEFDTESEENKAEVPKILPESIEFNPFKQAPRFNPLPMLIRLNSQENKVLGKETSQGGKYLKDNVYKAEISIVTNPGETLSDPELVDEDPAVEAKSNKDAIIESIKRKLYFITTRSSVQDSTNTPMNTPVPVETDDDNDYEKRVDELQTKTYSISNIGHKTNEAKTASSVTSIATDNTYKITAETIEEIYSYNVTDNNIGNSTTENELSFDTNIVHNKLTKDERPGADDFITSPTGDYKQYLDDIENNITKRNVTNENGFNFNITRVGNELTRSAYGADDVKTSTEELKRAKSLAELDLGDAVHGQVRRIVGRIKSVDFSRRESVKTEINIKEMPKKLSVLEKIALYEGKTARSRYESTTTIKTTTTKNNITPVISEEDYLKKIQELTTGKTTFGRLENMLYLPLADGSEIPVLALGTALVDPRLLQHIIGAAIDMGYRAIDTAYIYGNEKEIGQAIKAKIDDGTVQREDLFIISKLWSTYHRSDLVEGACKASLENMGLGYFDLYLIHNPMSFKEGSDPIPKIATVLQYSQHDFLDAWIGIEGLVTKGLVKSVGVSNFNSQQIQRILDKGKLKPVINQVECHPYLTQQRLHSFCVERNIRLSCFGALGSKGTPAEYKNSTTPVIDDALVKVMASGLGVTPAQLLIRYQIESGHNVVVKASSAAHLWDNLQALTFTLDPPQVAALHALNKNKRTFTFNGMGDTHKNYPFLSTY